VSGNLPLKGELKMCRLFAITSQKPLSPMIALEALDVMREGHDCSGVGIFLRDLAGPFEEIKDAPILSGIFSDKGLKRLDTFMMDIGFMTKYKISIKVPKTQPPGVPRRDVYLIRAYEYPEEWEDFNQQELYEQLLTIRLQLRQMGEEKNDMIVFSFWPDVIMIKEIGDPMLVARHLNLDRKDGGPSFESGSQGTSRARHHGPGPPKHQLRDYTLCMSSVFYPRLYDHDQRGKYSLCSHSIFSGIARIFRIYRLPIRFRSVHPYPALYDLQAWIGP
jgi:hypothetical protein